LLVLVGVIGVGLIGYAALCSFANAKFHRSPALDLVFEGDGTDCVFRYSGTVGIQRVGTTIVGVPPFEFDHGKLYDGPVSPPYMQCTMVRLHAVNLRDRAVNKVTVRLRGARRVAGGALAHPHADFLRWRHDNGPERQLSISGRRIRPGADLDAFIDLATKGHASSEFVLEFAQINLRQDTLAAEDTYVHVEAEGFDEETGRPVPMCSKAFLLSISEDGGLDVVPKALEECGFA
jgi:hypothetical protein